MKSLIITLLAGASLSANAATDRLEQAIEVHCTSAKTGNIYSILPSYGELVASTSTGERLIDDDGYTDRIIHWDDGVQIDLAHHTTPNILDVILFQPNERPEIIEGSIALTHFEGPDGKSFAENDDNLECKIAR